MVWHPAKLETPVSLFVLFVGVGLLRTVDVGAAAPQGAAASQACRHATAGTEMPAKVAVSSRPASCPAQPATRQSSRDKKCGRIDPYSRSQAIRAVVQSLSQDVLGSRLRLRAGVVRLREDVPGWILYRIAGEPYARRADCSGPIEVDIAHLPDGTYELEVQAVSGGIVYQWPPTVAVFQIKRDPDQVLKELQRMLGGSPAEAARAVHFLRWHPDPYLPALEDHFAQQSRIIRLLRASRPRRPMKRELPALVQKMVRGRPPGSYYRIRPREGKPDTAGVNLADAPHLNSFFKFVPADPDGQYSGARAFLLADGAVWFAYWAGIGRIDLRTHEIKTYGPNEGVPLKRVYRLMRGWDGGVYFVAGYLRGPGLYRYDPAEDLFLPMKLGSDIRTGRTRPILFCAVDANGVMWGQVVSQGNSALAWLDGEGIHFSGSTGGRIGPMVRGPDGKIWAHGAAVTDDEQCWPFYRVEILLRDFWPDQGAFAYSVNLHTDYLGNVATSRGPRSFSLYLPTWENLGSCPPQDYGDLIPDSSRWEFWRLHVDRFENVTRACDPRLPPGERWSLPPLALEQRKINEICFVRPDCVFLGEDDGLWHFEGKAWRRLRMHPPAASVEPDKTHLGDYYLAVLRRRTRVFTRRSASEIHIRDDCPESSRPPASSYRIERRYVRKKTGNRTFATVLIARYPDGRERMWEVPKGFEQKARLTADYEGGVWLFTPWKVARFENGTFQILQPPGREKLRDVRGVIPTAGGAVWIRAGQQAWLYEDGVLKKKVSLRGVEFDRILNIFYDERRELLAVAGVMGREVVGAVLEDGLLRMIHLPTGAESSMSVPTLCVDGKGRFWISNRNGLFCRHDQWLRLTSSRVELLDVDDAGRVIMNAAGGTWLIEQR